MVNFPEWGNEISKKGRFSCPPFIFISKRRKKLKVESRKSKKNINFKLKKRNS